MASSVTLVLDQLQVQQDCKPRVSVCKQLFGASSWNAVTMGQQSVEVFMPPAVASAGLGAFWTRLVKIDDDLKSGAPMVRSSAWWAAAALCNLHFTLQSVKSEDTSLGPICISAGSNAFSWGSVE